MNKCPHPNCAAIIDRTQYACKRHWFSLPQKIRKEIWRGYRGEPHSDWHQADADAKKFWQDSLPKGSNENDSRKHD